MRTEEMGWKPILRKYKLHPQIHRQAQDLGDAPGLGEAAAGGVRAGRHRGFR